MARFLALAVFEAHRIEEDMESSEELIEGKGSVVWFELEEQFVQSAPLAVKTGETTLTGTCGGG